MNQQTINSKHLYDKEIRFLFTQIICETESLYEKVVKKQSSNTQSSFDSAKLTSKN